MQEGGNTKKSKILAWTFLSIIICAFFSIIFSITFSINTYADTSQGDPRVTAVKKIYYQAIKECISDSSHFKSDNIHGVTPKNIKNGEWFKNELFGDLKSTYLEVIVRKNHNYENGIISCGDKDNKLFKEAVKALGFNYLDLACDASTDYVQNGIFDAGGNGCGNAIKNDNANGLTLSSNRMEHLEKVVSDKTGIADLNSFTNLEKYYIYYDTFKAVCAVGDAKFGTNGSSLPYKIQEYNKETGKIETAGYSKNKDAPNGSMPILKDDTKTCDELVTVLNGGELFDAYKQYVDKTIEEGGTIGDVAPLTSDKNACNSADLNGQNWILCSTGKNLSDTTTGLFKIVEDMLSVDTELYQSDSKVYDFWEFCRNAANIVMIIILLIIIFSQLTGFGIDNYGIKKMLPKLITMAILINVSFFICQIVIDISNIIGSSMDGFFQNITGGTTPKDVITGVVSALVGAGAGGVAAGGTVATVLALTGATGGIIWVIIGIVLAVYILVGLATIFTMLSLRMVIILVVIGTAPLALACNILPNTKNVFKKWFDAFKAAVIVYPIIGALHGLSAVVRDITFGSDVPFAFIIGCIATILPYYLIPTLLKKAINATGMIGSAITGMGQSLKRGVQQAGNIAKNSEAVKDRANRLGANLNQRYLDRNFDKDGKHLTGQDKRDYQDLVAAKNANQPYDAARLAELEKKNLSKFSTRYQRNMARANAAAEARKAKDAQTLAGASSVLSAGRTAEAETKQALADQGAAGALRGYYRDNEGNIYTRVSGDHEYEYKYTDKNGKLQTGKVKANAGDYVHTDKNGVQVLTAEQVRNNINAGGGQGISQKDAALAQNRINQDKQYGALGAYAASETRIADAANAANLSSLGSGVDSLTSSIQAGEGEVLQVQHMKSANEQVLSAAKNKVDLTPVITETYAQTLEQQRFDTAQRQMYSEEFKNQTRGQVGSIVESLIKDPTGATTKSQDTNYVAAAISDFISKGGNEDFLTYVANNSNDIKKNPALKQIIDNTMATMTEGTAKQYGKYVNAIADYNAKNKTNLTASSFADWLKSVDGTDIVGSGSISSEKLYFGGYQSSIAGDITGRTKDEYKFMVGQPDIYTQIAPESAFYAALSSKGDALVAANALLDKTIGTDETKRAKIIESIKVDDATKTTNATWTAMLGHDVSDTSFIPTGTTLTALQNFRSKIYDFDQTTNRYVPKKGLERAAANLSDDIKRLMGV